MSSHAWYLRLAWLAHWTLRCCLSRYQHCKDLTTKALRIIWDLARATVLIIIKLMVIAYRLTIGKMETDIKETTVPDLIRSNNYKVRVRLRLQSESIKFKCDRWRLIRW